MSARVNRFGVAASVFVVLVAGLVSACGADETNIRAKGPDGPLGGVMLLPENQKAQDYVLIIPGSGPTDRDGNSPMGIKASTYRLLAQGLAKSGIASVRIDKRGMFSSAKAISDANKVSMADYAGDVQGWVKTIKQQTKTSCIWVLGHSEGGLVALKASQTMHGEFCGLILVATPGRPASQVLREQMRTFAKTKEVLKQSLSAIDALQAGKHIDTSKMHSALKPVFRAEVQDFMISMMAIDPVALIADYQEPVLILQGTRDLQVKPTDAKALKKANPKAELVLLDDVNHVLKTVISGDPKANMLTYFKSGLPLADGVVDAIARFIKDNSPGR